MRIWISNRQRKITVNPEKLRRRAGRILNALGWGKAELSLTLLGDKAMARLNRETFGRRGPTNVIAFPLNMGLTAPGFTGDMPKTEDRRPKTGIPTLMLGEVVISLETTARQAREGGWPFQELLDFFLVHGILHLLGYDHETAGDEASMTEKTWELMGVLYPRLRGNGLGLKD
jgi:probable rRNA maturation factor